MKTTGNLIKYEFHMSIRRPSIWLGFGSIFILYISKLLVDGVSPSLSELAVLQTAGRIAGNLNLFFPVISGVLSADRISRDFSLGIDELQNSTTIRSRQYIVGKFLGLLLSLLFIQLIIFLIVALTLTVMGMPVTILLYLLFAFLVITVPAAMFVVIFSLTFPLLIPMRVYQILFTGYWIWGNYLDPATIPSISDSILNVSGRYANEVLFKVVVGRTLPVPPELSDLVMNWTVMIVLVFAGFFLLERILKKRRES